MPTLQLQLTPTQAAPRIRALARGLTALSTRILGKREEVTALLVEEVVASRWFIAGEPPQRPTAHLEISITAGTNTAEEKEAFIAAAWRELQQELGPLEEASYVVVRELPATDWGYGGRTQAARRLSALSKV
jgi:4-oxalocrotonate tautomerase